MDRRREKLLYGNKENIRTIRPTLFSEEFRINIDEKKKQIGDVIIQNGKPIELYLNNLTSY